MSKSINDVTQKVGDLYLNNKWGKPVFCSIRFNSRLRFATISTIGGRVYFIWNTVLLAQPICTQS